MFVVPGPLFYNVLYSFIQIALLLIIERNKGNIGAELELDEKIRKIKENNAKILARQKEIEREKAMFR